jgi:hypothetical protein
MSDCDALLTTMPGVPVDQFQSFAASCGELQAGAGQMLQPVAVQMFRVLVDTEAAAQAGSMLPGGPAPSPTGPIVPINPLVPPPPPPPAAGDDPAGVQEYHATCTAADVASCVPVCNAEHHGFELLATIDGTDTKFSCNLAHGLYSWMGAASDGGYLGADIRAFFYSVVSSAPGTYIVTMEGDAAMGADLTVHPGMHVAIGGSGSPPSLGSNIEVQGGASLRLKSVKLPIISMNGGGNTVTIDDCQYVSEYRDPTSALAASTASQFHCNPAGGINNNGINGASSGTLTVIDTSLPVDFFSSVLNCVRPHGMTTLRVDRVTLLDKPQYGQLTGSWVASTAECYASYCADNAASHVVSSTMGSISSQDLESLAKPCCSSGNCCSGLSGRSGYPADYWAPGSAACLAAECCGDGCSGCAGCGYQDDCDLAC